MDQSKKFLYINSEPGDADKSISYPVKSLVAVDSQAANTVILHFRDGSRSDTTNVTITVTSGKTKQVMQAIAEAISFDKSHTITIGDDQLKSYLTSDILSVAPVAFGDSTFEVQSDMEIGGLLTVTNGGAVTQASNRTTGVTLNTHTGKVTGDDASLAAVTIAKHTVTNSKVAADSVIIVNKVSGDADSSVYVDAVAAGSFVVAVRNNHASAADTTLLAYNFVVIGGSAS